MYFYKCIECVLKNLYNTNMINDISPDNWYAAFVVTRGEDKEIIGFSDVLFENGKVKVVDGPLLSMEGQIISIDQRKGRAKVLLAFLGEERTVELGISVLRPA